MLLSAIVAMNPDRVIGKNGMLPWHLPADLKHFKSLTESHHILMGRKCYDSIGRPLPKRTNLILTRNPKFQPVGCTIIHSMEEGIQRANAAGEKELFIIGGAEIYSATQHLWDRLYLTMVHTKVEGADTWFPDIPMHEWHCISQQAFEADDKNPFPYEFREYHRRLLA